MKARGFEHGRGHRANGRMRDPLAALVHESLLTDTDSLALLRAKSLSLLGLFSFFLAPFVALSHFRSGGFFTGSVIMGAGCCGLLSAILIKRRGAIKISGHILCTALWCGIGAGIYTLGYLTSNSIPWVALIPVIALIFGGLRVGLVWLAISWGIFITVQLALPASSAVADATLYHNATPHRIVTTTVYMLLLVGMIAATEWIREWTFKKLRFEEQQTKNIMEVFPDGIATIDASGEVLEMNLAAKRIFDEFGREELLAFADNMKEARADWSNEEVYLELEYLAVHTLDENETWILIIRDVTAARLNALTLKRTMEAANRASDAKTQFVAMLSHELRTPLNAVVGYSELILDALDDEDPMAATEDAQNLQLATKHLRALIDATLDLAKIESGKLLLDLSEVSIAVMLREVSRAMRPMIEENNNTLVLDIDEEIDDLTLQTDNLKLRQVLINLLSNAAKYTENAEVRLHASRSPDGLTICVSDQGEGMSEQTLARVWEEFVQADETALSQNGGTGLGLALVKRLSHLLGGHIEVESSLGEGTTFTLMLPHELTLIAPPGKPAIETPRTRVSPGAARETSRGRGLLV